MLLSVLILSCDPDEAEKKKQPNTQEQDKDDNNNQPITPPEQPPKPPAPIASLGTISDNAKKDASKTGWVFQGQPITFSTTAKDKNDNPIPAAQFVWQWRKRGKEKPSSFGRIWTEITGQTTKTATLRIPADERVGAYELKVSATSGGQTVKSKKIYKFTVRKDGCLAPSTTNRPADRDQLVKMVGVSSPSVPDKDIPAIDTSLITDMNNLLKDNNSFNVAINCWDVSNVTNMTGVFNSISAFNQNIGDWDTSEATSTAIMFLGARDFNNRGNASIGNWDVSKVENMIAMFNGAANFNQDLSGWDVKNVKKCSSFSSFSGRLRRPNFPTGC